MFYYAKYYSFIGEIVVQNSFELENDPMGQLFFYFVTYRVQSDYRKVCLKCLLVRH